MSGQTTWQESEGTGLVPEYVPWKPNEAEAAGPIEPFQLALVAETELPDWVTVALQLPVICWLPPYVQVTRQPPIAEAPVLRTVTLVTNPLPQSLWTA